MKKIKFRAWCKESSEMKYPEDFDSGDFYLQLSNNGFLEAVAYIYDSDDNSSYYYPEIELMQFTGLKDKNNVEIYEDDIVILSHPAWRAKGIIKFFNDTACFGFESIDKIDNGTRKSFKNIIEDKNGIEVIGNIYENDYLIND